MYSVKERDNNNNNNSTYLFFNFLQLVALLTDVMQQLHSFVIFSGHLHTSFLKASLQALWAHMSKLNQSWYYWSKSGLHLKGFKDSKAPKRGGGSYFACITTCGNAIKTHTALCNVGGKVLLQNAPLGFRCLQLHILLVEHWFQVSHFTLKPGNLLLHLSQPEEKVLV